MLSDKISGIQETAMNLKQYIGALIASNMVMFGIGYIILRFQNLLPGNPSNIQAMNPLLAFNTAVSFLTNTNLQHYSGETGLSYFSQMLVIIFLMFTTPATGLAICMAFFRGITGKKTLGNYYVDLVRCHTRILIPLAVAVGLVLVSQGVPQTLHSTVVSTTLEGKEQLIARGPVAALESIKHIGTNGGGFFGVNSAHPYENPTPFSNVLEIISMFLVPMSLPLVFGRMTNKIKNGWIILAAMGLMFIAFLSVGYLSEARGNTRIRTNRSLSRKWQYGRERSTFWNSTNCFIYSSDYGCYNRNSEQHA